MVQKKLKEAKATTLLLPRPSFMKKVRQKINDRIINLLGQPFCIVGVYQGKEKAKRYEEFNNIFFDLVSVQKKMIQFYKLSHEEASGIAKFVIKLDKTEIVKCK